MTFSLCVGELTDLSAASAKSFARTGHELYVYPREQSDAAKFEILRQAGVCICDAGAFCSRPVRYEHPRWGRLRPLRRRLPLHRHETARDTMGRLGQPSV